MAISIPQRVSGSFQYRRPGQVPPGGGLAAAASADPFAQLTPAQIQQQVGQYTSQLPKPLTDQQISSRAQGEINPILQKITDAINARAQSAGQAISGYTNDLASKLGKTDYAAPYSGAIQQQAGVDAALSQALAGGGLSDAQGLQSRLAQIGEPGVVGAAANAVQGNATGNSNAALAGGSADLSALIASQAAAGAYGVKQPGIARLAGLQDLAGANQTAQQNIKDQSAQVETQLPSILNDLRSQSDTRQSNITSLGADLYKTLTGQNVTKATAQAGLTLDTGKALAPQTFGSASSGYYQYDPATGQIAQVTPGVPKTVPPRTVSPGSTLVDPTTGNVIYSAPPKPSGGTAATGGLSASGWLSLVASASKQAAALSTTVAARQHYPAGGGDPVNVPGTGKQAAPYNDALNQIFALGPNTKAWATKTRQIVDARYAPGENGRPWGAQAVPAAIKTAKTAYTNGMTIADARAKMLAANLPQDAVGKAIQRVYYSGAFSPVNGAPPKRP